MRGWNSFCQTETVTRRKVDVSADAVGAATSGRIDCGDGTQATTDERPGQENSYYSALPAALPSEVKVRIFEREIHILARDGTALRRFDEAKHRASFVIPGEDRVFNPSRSSVYSRA